MLAFPKTLPDTERGHPGDYHCDTCVKSKPQPKRARMHCGLMPRSEWRDDIPRTRNEVPRKIFGVPYTADECPGQLVRLPIVTEAAQAYEASEAGILERWDPDDLAVVNDAVMALRRSFGLHQIMKLKPSGAPPPRGP